MSCCSSLNPTSESRHYDTCRTGRKCWRVSIPLLVALMILSALVIAEIIPLPQGVGIGGVVVSALILTFYSCKKRHEKSVTYQPETPRTPLPAQPRPPRSKTPASVDSVSSDLSGGDFSSTPPRMSLFDDE